MNLRNSDACLVWGGGLGWTGKPVGNPKPGNLPMAFLGAIASLASNNIAATTPVEAWENIDMAAEFLPNTKILRISKEEHQSRRAQSSKSERSKSSQSS